MVTCPPNSKKMLNLAHQWADDMRTGRIAWQEVRLSLISTIWRSLLYSLLVLNLTKQQCKKIMSPILQYCLPAMGYCRNFPRANVFAPRKYMGIGICHLFTLQEILWLKDMINHSYYGTDTGNLYQTSLELLLLEFGQGSNLFKISFTMYSRLATTSLYSATAT